MGNRIKALRENAGLTQDELGELAKTTGQQIARLETGQRGLTDKWMARLAPHLGAGIKPAMLMEGGPAVPGLPNLGPDFTDEIDEIELLGLYRDLDFETKVAFVNLARVIGKKRSNDLSSKKSA